jgi:hypothetical protein
MKFRAMHLSACLICFGILSHPVAAEPLHKRLQAGTSYLILQEAEMESRKSTYYPRFDLIYKNNSGDIAVYAGDGPASEVKPQPNSRRLITADYFLSSQGCMVDFTAGETLLTGEQCDAPLPKAWQYLQRKSEVSCHSMQPASERIDSKVGSFDALKIQCQRALDNPKRTQTTTYWYEPTLGVMLRVERRALNDRGELDFFTTEQLVEIAPVPRD